MNTIFSNRIEALFTLLSDRLIRGASHPFTPRFIIVPGPRVKQWLQKKIADDPRLSTTLGLAILPLEEALYLLKTKLIGVEKKCPSLFELSCLIESEGKEIFEKTPELSEWLKGGEKKKLSLVETLAPLFQKYGRFSPHTLSGWQKTLWDRLFHPESTWTYPYESYSGEITATNSEIYLFGFSFLSHLEFAFFKRAAALHPVSLFLLSPCLHFWSDQATDREKRFLLNHATDSTFEALNTLLSDTNPLLANFGKMGREMAKELEGSDIEPLNAYMVPKETLSHGDYDLFEEGAFLTDERGSLLRTLQTDFLLLRNPRVTDPIDVKPGDRSIELHRFPNKMREIEGLRALILRLNQEGISDILVMAPDISAYEPYITAYFDDIPWIITDKKKLSKHPLVSLFDFYEEPDNQALLLALLEEAPFDAEEKEALREVAEINRLYQQGITPIMTRLMGEKCQTTRLEVWDKLALFLSTLRAGEPKAEASLSEWADWLGTLPVETPEFLIQEFKAKGERLLKPISYPLFRSLVTKSLLREEEKRGDHRIGAVRFSSLAPMRVVPAEAILLLGMEEGSLPRHETKHPLDQSDGDFAPTQGDFDRTLFLETLLSAREHLFFLWSGTETPCRLVDELLSYLKMAFKAAPLPVMHPEWGDDPWYNTSNCPFKTFQEPEKSLAKTAAPPLSESKLKSDLVTLAELKKLLKDPIAFYEQAKGFKRPYQGQTNDSATFKLSNLEKWQVHAKTLAKKPLPSFGEGLISELKQEQAENLQTTLLSHIETKELTLSNPEFIAPRPDLPLYGEIEGIAKDGLVIEGKARAKKVLDALPEILLLMEKDPQKNTLHFTDEKKKRTVTCDPTVMLKNLLAYANRAKTTPYPFAPDILKPLLEKNLKGLKKELEEYGIEADAETILSEYHDEASALFGPIQELL